MLSPELRECHLHHKGGRRLNRFSLSLRNQCAVRGPPRRRRPSRARDRKPRVHSDASYQTYCHAKAITITTTAVNRPSCAQTLAAKLRPSVLSLWIVMAMTSLSDAISNGGSQAGAHGRKRALI